jgi:hypothetical protein
MTSPPRTLRRSPERVVTLRRPLGVACHLIPRRSIVAPSVVALGVAALSIIANVSCVNGARDPQALTTPMPLAGPGSSWTELYRGPLTDFVPAAGLRWLVVGAPSYFAQHPALESLRDHWLTTARFRAFADATGIDLVRTERALVAGFDLATLYMVDGSAWLGAPEDSFSERLAGSATVHRPHPYIWRITGLSGSTPETLLRVDHDLLAVAVGDPTPARVVELRARKRLHSVAPALRGAALSTLPDEFLRDGPLELYALGPFQGEWLASGRGLLGAVQALGARIDLEAERLGLRVALSGFWDASSDRDGLVALWHAVATSSVGAALGFDQPLVAPSFDVSEHVLVFGVTLSVPRLLAGLEPLLSGEVDRLFGDPDAAPRRALPN